VVRSSAASDVYKRQVCGGRGVVADRVFGVAGERGGVVGGGGDLVEGDWDVVEARGARFFLPRVVRTGIDACFGFERAGGGDSGESEAAGAEDVLPPADELEERVSRAGAACR
jgi:hypothetical protein